jgi:hypothetical protein
LVTAATGGKRAFGPFLEMDIDGYKGSFDKLWGYANVVRYGAKHVKDGGSITLVSGAPARNCQPGQIALSSVGNAIEAMMRAGRSRSGTAHSDKCCISRNNRHSDGHCTRCGAGGPI